MHSLKRIFILDRELDIEIDRASWGARPVPANFSSGRETFNIGEVLLTIGVITAPPRASGFSLAEYWAWVRYASAISSGRRLSLVPEYVDLDAHQKTILSDDFGMGFSVYWMWRRMNFSFICDGRYFVDRYLTHYRGARTARTPGKRGPTKCPDFVCWQPAGSFHVVECKGTQSGSAARAKQIATAKGQKTTINFPATRQGERLACGMAIAFEGGRGLSHLFVTDPEYKPVVSVDESQVEFVEDTMHRGLGARVLGITGFPATALALAEPNIGEIAASRSKSSEKKRQEWRDIDLHRQKRSEEELTVEAGRAVFHSDRNQYIGKEREYEFPVPVDLGNRVSKRVVVRQGINQQVVRDFSPSAFSKRVADDHGKGIVDLASDFRSGSSDNESYIGVGELYRAEMIFL